MASGVGPYNVEMILVAVVTERKKTIAILFNFFRFRGKEVDFAR